MFRKLGKKLIELGLYDLENKRMKKRNRKEKKNKTKENKWKRKNQKLRMIKICVNLSEL